MQLGSCTSPEQGFFNTFRRVPEASLTSQNNQLVIHSTCLARYLTSISVGGCRCTDMQQALDSLQEASSSPMEAGRGVVASAGGRQMKRALRSFADAHQG